MLKRTLSDDLHEPKRKLTSCFHRIVQSWIIFKNIIKRIPTISNNSEEVGSWYAFGKFCQTHVPKYLGFLLPNVKI